jgi:hypothetical protein
MLSQNSAQSTTQIYIQSHTDSASSVDYSVYFGTLFIGSIDKFPVWGLDSNYDVMLQAGLSKTDCCYMVEQQPYATLELAAAHLVAAFLVKAGRFDRAD